jgi:hypothetical protein
MGRMIGLALCGGILLAAGPLAAQQAVSPNVLLGDSEWRRVYDGYEPDTALLEALKEKIGGTRLVVVLGTWCDDSRENVPPFLKLMNLLGPAAPDVAYLGVERKGDPQQKFYVPELAVERIPTFIVYRGDREIGRIVEKPRESILGDLLQIVF